MNHDNIINKIEANAPTFKSLLENISNEQTHWKPSPEKWSLLEIVNHLYDEEREDFRQRIKNIFEDPEKAWTPIAPAEWIRESTPKERLMHH